MARVSAAEGISYGVGLFGYMLGIVVFGLLFQIVGIGIIVSEQYVIGAILFLIGGVATYSGLTGTIYKVIADAVHKGTQDPEAAMTASKVSDSGDTARKIADDATEDPAQTVINSSGGSQVARKVPEDSGTSTGTTVDGDSE